MSSVETKQSRYGVWTWVSVGVGTGLLVTLLAGLGYRYIETHRRQPDPRAEKVRELIEEAERLLAQGRRGTPK
jgi:hypothetical protein